MLPLELLGAIVLLLVSATIIDSCIFPTFSNFKRINLCTLFLYVCVCDRGPLLNKKASANQGSSGIFEPSLYLSSKCNKYIVLVLVIALP